MSAAAGLSEADVTILVRSLQTLENGFVSVCPVFISKFRILQNSNEKDSSVDSPIREPETPEGSDATDVPRDEDGDLDVVRRPRNGTCHRDTVCPVILSQSAATLCDQDEDSEEEEGACDIIRIGQDFFFD